MKKNKHTNNDDNFLWRMFFNVLLFIITNETILEIEKIKIVQCNMKIIENDINID